MKTKKLVKPIAILLAIVLIISAFPITGLSFLSQTSSAASTVNASMETNDSGEITNLDNAYKTLEAENGSVYVWLTNTGEGRNYQVSEYVNTEDAAFQYSESFAEDFNISDLTYGEGLVAEETENGFTVSIKEGYDMETAVDSDFIVSFIMSAISEDADLSDVEYAQMQTGSVTQSMTLTGVMTYAGMTLEITDTDPINFTISNGNGNVTANLYVSDPVDTDTDLAALTESMDAIETKEELSNSNYSFDTEPESATTYIVEVTDALGYTAYQSLTTEEKIATQTAASVPMLMSARASDTVRPTNPLGIYDGDTNLVTQTFDTISNTSGSSIATMTVTTTMPVRNSEGEDILLKPETITIGTYYGFSGTVNLRVYYKTNIDASWQTAFNGECGNTENTKIAVSDLHLGNGEYITEVRYEYTNVPSGFTVYTAPQISSALEYTGLTEDFTIETSYEVNTGSNRVETETFNVNNPVITIYVYYKDIDTDEEIPYREVTGYGDWETITRRVQAYSEFRNLGRVNIPNYTMPTSGADVHPENVSNYNADTFSGYVNNTDVTIVHYYKALTVNLLEPEITSKYATLFNGDNNALYIENLGTKNNGNIGNQVLDNYTITISIPKEMNITQMVTPAFRNGNAVNFTTYYKTNLNDQWRQTDIALSSADMHTITFDLESGEIVTAIEMRFVPTQDSIPTDFYNINRGILEGIINTDATENLNITASITSTATYTTINNSGNETSASTSKTGSLSIDVIVPQIIDMTDGAAARLQAGDKFSYVWNNIASNGQVVYSDYTIKDTFSDMITIEQLKTGTFNSVIGSKYQIIIEKADGTVITEDCVSTTSKTIEINDTVASITYIFESVGKNFNAATAPVIDAVVKDTAKNGSQFKNIIEVSAVWTSANEPDVQDTVEKTFTTITNIVKPEIMVPEILISERLFNNQPAEFKLGNIGNKGNTEIYDFTVTVDVPNNVTLNEIQTGVWKNTAWSGNELTVEYQNENGEWIEIGSFTDFANNHTISDSVLAKATAIRYIFKVAPLGFVCTTEPALITTVDNDLAEGHTIGCMVEVTGVFGPTSEMDTTTIPDTSGFKAVDSTFDSSSSRIVIPKFSTPVISAPESVKYDEQIVYSLTNFNNTGDTYLYDVSFAFTFDQAEKIRITSVGSGSWNGVNAFDIQYTILNMEDGTERRVTTRANNTNETMTLPEMAETETISSIAFDFGTVTEDFAVVNAPEIIAVFDSEDVAPEEVLSATFTYNALGGYAYDPAEPTAAELEAMPHRFADTIVVETIVMKPEIAIPALSVPTETMRYREQFAYTVDNIYNSGNTYLDDFYVINSLERVRVLSMIMPEFNADGTYDIMYRTNDNEEWQMWERNVDMDTAQEIYVPEFDDGVYITDIRLDFGTVEDGFKNTTPWQINVINWSDAYDTTDVANNVEVNGVFEETSLSSKNRVLYTPILPDLAQSNIGKTYPTAAYPTMTFSTIYENLTNNTEASIDYFTLSDTFGAEVQPTILHTGVYTTGLSEGTFSIIYQTNKSGEGWYELESAQDITSNDAIEFPELDGEYITAVKLVYGTVEPGFKAIEAPVMEIEFTEALENHSEFTSTVSIEGFIDGRTFGESASYTVAVNYGWVVVELYNDETGEKIGEDGRYYGNTGEEYNITTYPIEGYELVRIEGNTQGTMKDGYTDTVKAFYKPLPKTGESPFTSWNFLVGASMLVIIGAVSLAQKQGKRKENA